MRALIRTDASLQIGSGHVMRCLGLAGALAARGMEVHFACRELPGHLCEAIAARGFTVHRLRPPDADDTPPVISKYASWLGVSEERDAVETRAVLETLGGVDLLVVDHYALGLYWERSLRSLTGRLFIIDDLADRRHDADAVLNQSLDGRALNGAALLLPPGCARLFGPRYALLRPEFAAARRHLRPRDGELRRLLVFLGGVDAGGYTERVLDALALLHRTVPETDVVAGPANPAAAALAARCRAGGGHLHIHENVDDMAALMAAADFAVGAGGLTAWERACVGLPALLLTVAENQRRGATVLARAGAALLLDGTVATPAAIAEQLEALTPERLREMSAHGLELVDGRGMDRVARVLWPPAVSLRRAVAADRDAILTWRNAPDVRRYARSDAAITPEQHRQWFDKVLDDPARPLLVAEDGGRPVGVLRYDCDGPAAEVSIYLVPGCAGRGYGPAVLRAGSTWLQRQRPETERIVADIHADNAPSHHAFTEAGYVYRDGRYVQELTP